ncbi:MAG: hypothetical protein DWB48_00075 [Nitrosomonas sp.]|nr:hypothetical protein [Nitrosomonas sp.]
MENQVDQTVNGIVRVAGRTARKWIAAVEANKIENKRADIRNDPKLLKNACMGEQYPRCF